MLGLAIAMGTVVWAMIGYALLSPNPPAPEGADYAHRAALSESGPARACRRSHCECLRPSLPSRATPLFGVAG